MTLFGNFIVMKGKEKEQIEVMRILKTLVLCLMYGQFIADPIKSRFRFSRSGEGLEILYF
jgi:hypothetical protein